MRRLTRYCNELATLENALLAFDPIRRTVPTTRTRITANITAYSAISCPESSAHSLRITLDICSPPRLAGARMEYMGPTWELGANHDACGTRPLSNAL